MQTLLHPVPSTSIVCTFIDYISKLCAWLFAYLGSRTMMVLRMFGTTVYASGNLTPNELMHVHRLGEVRCISQKA